MALRGAAARRYAQAILEIAREGNSLDRWLTDLTLLNSVFGTPQAVAALEDPRFTPEMQQRIATEALTGSVQSRPQVQQQPPASQQTAPLPGARVAGEPLAQTPDGGTAQPGSTQQATPPVDQLAINLLLLLVKRQRVGLLPRILEVFRELYNKEKGIVVANVTTAVPLDDAHKQRVAQQLSRITGKTVELHTHQDPRILGGVITRIGDQLIDTSLATQLAELGERLS